MTDEPVLTFCKCLSCKKLWTAFCPNGVDDKAGFQCPACKRFQGVSIDAPITTYNPDFHTAEWFRGALKVLLAVVIFTLAACAVWSMVWA